MLLVALSLRYLSANRQGRQARPRSSPWQDDV